uniref:Uncharacterized protein n=1 Tax=Pyricularia oryzae (strain P131) TaxID=1143193 RepID=L7JN52_PYRO1
MNIPGHERNVQAEQMPNLRNLGLSKSSQRPIREPLGSGSGCEHPPPDSPEGLRLGFGGFLNWGNITISANKSWSKLN